MSTTKGELPMTTIENFGAERFSNRELSRLEFASRLLDLADDTSLPLLERSKFVAIYAEMLDEFFQVRVVSLEDKIAAGITTPSLDGLRPLDQLRAVRERVLTLTDRLEDIVMQGIIPQLAQEGIQIIPYASLGADEQAARGGDIDRRPGGAADTDGHSRASDADIRALRVGDEDRSRDGHRAGGAGSDRDDSARGGTD
jgi:hypothetical protein